MRYYTDSNGEKLSVIGCGCMRFPNDFEKCKQLFLQAVESGINYFDTAYIYSGNEDMLGRIFAETKLREQVNVATKLPPFMCKSNADFDKIFSKQLARLKTDYIDYYLIHMLANADQWKRLCDHGIEKWIEQKKQSGKIRRIGFSFHGKSGDFVELIDAYGWEFCQIQYNYLDVSNQAGQSGLKYAAEKHIPVVIMEPLRGGLLADRKLMPPEATKIFETSEPRQTPAAWGLKWLWNQEQVAVVLSGVRDLEQLRENVRIADESAPNALSPAELGVIDSVTAAFKSMNRIPCTGCAYCMPCPVGVNIPGCFEAYNASYAFKKSKAFNLYLMSTGAVQSKKGTAGGCVGCGKCETHCPQSIPIREGLKAVRKRMEPLWFRAAMPIVRKFMK